MPYIVLGLLMGLIAAAILCGVHFATFSKRTLSWLIYVESALFLLFAPFVAFAPRLFPTAEWMEMLLQRHAYYVALCVGVAISLPLLYRLILSEIARPQQPTFQTMRETIRQLREQDARLLETIQREQRANHGDLTDLLAQRLNLLLRQEHLLHQGINVLLEQKQALVRSALSAGERTTLDSTERQRIDCAYLEFYEYLQEVQPQIARLETKAFPRN